MDPARFASVVAAQPVTPEAPHSPRLLQDIPRVRIGLDSCGQPREAGRHLAYQLVNLTADDRAEKPTDGGKRRQRRHHHQAQASDGSDSGRFVDEPRRRTQTDRHQHRAKKQNHQS